MTSCGEIFEIGCFPLIHGKITTLPVDRTTRGLQRGFFKVTRSRNGKHPDQVPFYGCTGNVSSSYSDYTFSEIDGFYPLAGAGKSVLWYVRHWGIFS